MSYYVFKPGQITGSGLGDCGCSGLGGCGCGGADCGCSGLGGCGCGGADCGCGGLGATTSFNAAAVWADVQKSDVCYAPAGLLFKKCSPAYDAKTNKQLPQPPECGPCNAAGGRATKAIQQGLIDAGYDPGVVDGAYGPNTRAAWVKFCGHAGVSPGALVSKDGIYALEKKLGGGGGSGGAKTPPPSTTKASMGAGMIALLLAGGVAVAYAATRKKTPARKSGATLISM